MAEELSTVKTLMNQTRLWKNNPAGIKRAVLDNLRNTSEGKISVVDTTNPFATLLESSCILTSAFMAEHESLLRKQYPSLALTIDDLYLHMSDKDYIDRFAIPAMTRFHLLIDFNELKSKLVLDPLTGIKKVTIPKNSEFIIADTTFSLQYGIDIKQLVHGGFQVTYDNSDISPLQTLTTNMVDWEILTFAQTQSEMMHLEFDVYQFKINSYLGDIPLSTGYSKKLQFNDEFWYARVYYKNSATGNQWKEMKTTHTEVVHDPLTPTASLKVLDSQLEVKIPQIYTSSGLVSGGIRIDIYETKGPIELLLDNYKPSQFKADFILIDKSQVTAEIAAFRSIDSVFAYANKTVSGGRKAIDFSTLRQRVIDNTIGVRNIPITNVQIETALENSGFSIVKNVDVITNRQYLATKALPKPFDQNLITSAQVSIQTLIASMDQLKAHPKVKNHNKRITLTPELLYKENNAIVSLVTDAELGQIQSLTPQEKADKINSENYIYSPFHYVLDATKDFDSRPYYMDKPLAKSVEFISENDTTGLQVATSGYRLVRTDSGYRLYTEVKSNSAYKALSDSLVHAQLVFNNTHSRAYLNGSLVGLNENNERIWVFEIDTDFDIDSHHQLYLTSFQSGTPGSYQLPAHLLSDFNIYYITSSTLPAGHMPKLADTELGSFLLPTQRAYITKEKISLLFGYYLKNLWNSHRSISSTPQYQTYLVDIPLTYSEDIYEIDPSTGSSFRVDSNGNLIYKLLHKKGDPVLDSQNRPVMQHKKGDTILDSNNNPIPISPTEVIHQLDMTFIEGNYYFTTDTAAKLYIQAAIDTMIDYITIQIESISSRLLEQTRIYYYPQSSLGYIKTLTDNSTITSYPALQTFNLTLYVNESTYLNNPLRQQLVKSTIKTIDTYLQNPTFSSSDLISLLKQTYSNDVIALDLTAFNTPHTKLVSILNPNHRFAIRKKLTTQPDNSLIVTEDINITFIKHSQ